MVYDTRALLERLKVKFEDVRWIGREIVTLIIN